MRKNLFIIALLYCLATIYFAVVLPAQTILTGGFSGSITNPTGAAVPGVMLTLSSNTAGDTYSTVASATGTFVFSLLKPGDYTLTAKNYGFKTTTQKIAVLPGQNSTVSFAMQLGDVTTTGEVTSEGNLQSQDANIATTFDTRTIQNIPNPGNDVTYIAQTAPDTDSNSLSTESFARKRC